MILMGIVSAGLKKKSLDLAIIVRDVNIIFQFGVEKIITRIM